MRKRNAIARSLSSVLVLSVFNSSCRALTIFGAGKVGRAVPSSENGVSMKWSGLNESNSGIGRRSSAQCDAFTKSFLLAGAAASKPALCCGRPGRLILTANKFPTLAFACGLSRLKATRATIIWPPAPQPNVATGVHRTRETMPNAMTRLISRFRRVFIKASSRTRDKEEHRLRLCSVKYHETDLLRKIYITLD